MIKQSKKEAGNPPASMMTDSMPLSHQSKPKGELPRMTISFDKSSVLLTSAKLCAFGEGSSTNAANLEVSSIERERALTLVISLSALTLGFDAEMTSSSN
tara:strand:- start:142 stop:441 length:300 start_codon:yes stop_codon:yes gene_type:complete